MRSGRLAPTAWIVALVLLGLTGPGWAHRDAGGRPAAAGSIATPTLSHGQMEVIAANKAAILDLADRQVLTDPTLRRLEGFISLQQFACLWGLMPGSIRDEGSPFNECAHAYLAATRALLMHLGTMPGDRPAVRALLAKIETEMLVSGTALVLCRYSDEGFNTADVISPHWADVPRHPPSWAALGGVLFAVSGGAWLASRKRSARPGTIPGSRA